MDIKRLFTQCNIYIALWLFYNLQGVLYPSGSVISQMLLVLLLVWSLMLCVKVNLMQKQPRYFKGLNLLMLMFLIYGIVLLLSGKDLYVSESGAVKVRNFDYLKSILISLSPIYAFYYYAKCSEFTCRHLSVWFYIFLGVIILQYFRTQHEVLMRVSADEITNNSGYLFASLLPCLIVFKKRRFMQYIFLSLCVLFVLASVKRGAIIISAVSSIFIISYNLLASKRRDRILTIVLSILICFISCKAVGHMLDTSDYFVMRLEQTLDGDDSNRSMMYQNLNNIFKYESSFFQMLFGRGAWGTLTVSMNFAHNDWLEILINQGLLGIIIFIVYWCLLYRESRNLTLSRSSRFTLLLIFVICLLKTFFSMSYSDMNIYITSVLGLSLANGFNEVDIK